MDQDTIAESFCQSYPQTTSAKYFCEPRAHASNNSLCTWLEGGGVLKKKEKR